jgi:type IV pilus assembly protein PilX
MISKSHKNQHGAILVTAMLLLLVLTIIGITAAQMTRMQERMAGNLRDQNLAFQGSEAGLRDGEELIRSAVDRPDTCIEAPCLFWTRGYLANVPTQDQDWWDDNATELEADGDRSSAAHDMADLESDPQFVVESLGFSTAGGSLVQGHGPLDGRDFFQVTARSTGGSGSATTVLRTTYARRF